MTLPRSHALVVDGLETALLEAGSGPVLLLLHGGAWGECADTAWAGTVERLAATHRVLAPDWLGFGGSAKVRDFADLPGRMTGHLARLLAALQVDEPVDVVGLSMGGSFLLRDLVSPAPRLRVRRAVLVSAGGPPIDRDTWARLADYDGTDASMRRQIALAFADPAWAQDEAYVARRVEASRRPGAWEFFATLQARAPWAPPPPPGDPVPYERVPVPTLVVAGGADPLKPPGWADPVVQRIPDARLHVVAGAGHCPQLEAADEFERVLLAFLTADLPPAPSVTAPAAPPAAPETLESR